MDFNKEGPRIVGLINRMGNGDRAAIARMKPGGALPGAFYRALPQEIGSEGVTNYAWALKAVAMTGLQADDGPPLRVALAAAGLSEARFVRLMTRAPGSDQLYRELLSVTHFLKDRPYKAADLLRLIHLTNTARTDFATNTARLYYAATYKDNS